VEESALDPQTRSLTLRLDGSDGRTVILPSRIWMAVAATSATGGWTWPMPPPATGPRDSPWGGALVRLTGTEHVNWLYVQLSRARQDTRLYAVVGPEPQDSGELDLPDRDRPNGYRQLAQALSRAGGQTLAIDTPSTPISSGCPRPSCGPSGTGSAASSTRCPATAPANWPGPPPTASTPRKPWLLRQLPAVLGLRGVVGLADQARVRFHAAA
jgi:hypothetical protein